MEIKQLQYVLATAERLSFTEAAQACFVVQSAISQQIAALERELGVQLFERNKRSLALTPEGEAFLREAKGILNQIAYSKAVVQSVSKGYQRILKIGCYGDLMREELPRILAGFREENPQVKLFVSHMGYHTLLDALQNQDIDAMLTLYLPEFRLYDWLDVQTVREDHVMLMLPASHHLASRQTVSVSELREERIILLSGIDKKERLGEWAETSGSPSVYHYADSQNSIETLVAAGYGVSPCVESACRPHPGIVYVPIAEDMRESICLIWRRNQKNALLERLLPLFMMTPS